jgi:transcriptional regulator with XRE-family HTH domain
MEAIMKKPKQSPESRYFSAQLKALRTRLGLSQADLAARSGVTREAIARYETGPRIPTLTVAQRLAEALGVNCTAFVRPKKK